MLQKHNALTMQYNTNKDGVPISIYIENEIKRVSIENNSIQLEQIPDEFYRLQVLDSKGQKMYETFGNEVEENELAYKVNYTHGIVYFHPKKNGEQITITYYGRGLQLIHASRIIFDDDIRLKEIVNSVNELKAKDVSTIATLENEMGQLKSELENLKQQVALLLEK